MRKTILIILIVILIGFVFSFGYWLKYIKTAEVSPERKIKELCAESPKIEGEIICEEAVRIALKEYPGDITSVKKTKTSYNDKEYDVWLVEILLEGSKGFKPKFAMIPVDVHNGNLYVRESI